MAKNPSLEKAKVAALLLFVTILVVLVAWTLWQAFDESSNKAFGDEYQAATGLTISVTPTENQWLSDPLPMPTDRYPLEN